ncbi:DHA2 family efflux MFS transporter permease subunit [Corynebacterium uropygiale]|uniref:DHA2 family efflux MFS transporter permease subunit n=1 Tax=Corynebacterium uropygiale TaxID=1775911 RepID=A0A9X1TZQ9_9CORY|nr:DHA2 family efflux MFS transporter permease subunit [Corynebacterium uropygiale]MCF4007176.1 DHA2 family efflux MFS transporter permease subunit [Corynebacterium uropygiale]
MGNAHTAYDQRHANSLIGCLVVATTVMILNETVLSVALPAMMSDFSITADVAQWLSTGFMLTMSVIIPVTGYIQKVLPTRTIFFLSMGLFLIGSLVAALAPAFGVVLAGRILQACGTAMMMPLLMTVVLTVVEPARRGAMMGIISVAIAVAPTVGPTLSGFVLSFATWHWLFWIMVVLSLIVGVGGAKLLINVGETERAPLDILSVLLSAVGFGGLVYALSSMSAALQSGNPTPIVCAVVGVLALAVFAWWQRRLLDGRGPLLDLRVLTYRNFALGLTAILCGFGVLIGAAMVIPLYLQGALGVSEFVTGLVVLPGGLLQGVVSPFIGRLYDRCGPRPIAIPGAVLLCLGVWAFVLVAPLGSVPLVVVAHVIMAVGMGFVMTPMMSAALGVLPEKLYSHGSAVLNTLQQLAGAAGTALLIAMMTLGQSMAANRGIEDPAGLLSFGTQMAFTVGGGLTVVVLLLTLWVRRPEDQEEAANTPA